MFARTVCGARALGRSPRPIPLLRALAFDIYNQAPAPVQKYAGGPKEVAEVIFLQHANEVGTSLAPGNAFKAACVSLIDAYPQLQALQNVALEGRLWSLMDTNADGMLDVDEFCNGVVQLLDPKWERYKHLAERLKKGYIPGQSGSYDHVKRVAIVGGGVAGLQTARALSKIGKECVVFEKCDNLGGVWRANYADFGLQVPKELYEFPEFPYPTGTAWEKFPPGPQVQQYIEAYAEEFGLNQMVRFNTGVQSIESQATADGNRGWNVRFSTAKNPSKMQEEQFDFVVMATGMYGWPPHIPAVRGQDQFEGTIAHSATFQDATACKGKRVVVIGGGKSAVDNAVSAAKHGDSSTLVFRSAHWPVPRLLLDLVPFKWGTYSRFGHFMLPTHYDVSPIAWYIHSLLTPIKWGWWRIVEAMFRLQFRLPREMVPDTPIEIDVFTGGQILNYEFRDMLKTGQVSAVKGSIEKFMKDGVQLQDGTFLPADIVVFETGFTKNYGLLDRLLQNKLHKEVDGLYLYRNVIPPRLPDFAFVGSEVSTFNNILTHALQAEWLARLLGGKMGLPRQGAMEQHIEKEQAWKRSWMPATSARASIHQLHMVKYHDQLVGDMGEKKLRKGWNFLAEAFEPYSAADYREIFIGKK